MSKHQLLLDLKRIAPNIVFAVTKIVDENFVWDGDGPDPADEDFEAYDVTFCATVILHGELVTGSAHLGGSYYKAGEPTGDVHGYLAQKLVEALNDLPDTHLEEVWRDYCAAKIHLKAYSRSEYEAQQKQKS